MTVAQISAQHLIGGEWVGGDGEGEFESHSTSDGSVIARAPIAGPEIVDRAVQSARRAFAESGWKERRAADRAAVLLELGRRIDEAAEDLARLVAAEMGKPLRLALDREIRGAADKCRYFAGAARAIEGEVTGASPAHILDITVPEPDRGLRADHPLERPGRPRRPQARRCAGRRLHGGGQAVRGDAGLDRGADAAVRRPARAAAWCGQHGARPGRPDRRGAGRTSRRRQGVVHRLDRHRQARSWRAASGTLKKVSLECGGKAPCLVFADCYLEKALDALSYGAFLYGGQSCTAATRIIVEDSLYDRFLEGLTERARGLAVGDPLDEKTLIGPLVSERQVGRVRDFLSSIEGDGGTLHLGGGIDGLHVEPTIVTGVSPESRVAQQEVFGPVVCVFRAADEEEAVSIANGVRFGLGASVWTADITRALRADPEAGGRRRVGQHALHPPVRDALRRLEGERHRPGAGDGRG